MITWPDDSKLTKIAKANVEAVRATTAVRELEDSTETWTLVNWPWMPEPPLRFLFRSETFEVRAITRGDNGLWTVSAAP